MVDSRGEFARYLAQRLELGERSVIFDHEFHASASDVENPSTIDHEPAQQDVTTPTPETPSPKWLEGAPDIPQDGIVIHVPDSHLFAIDALRDLTLAGLGEIVRKCDQCGLCKDRKNAVPGEGPDDAKLMVIGEGPGATEDETGRPFVGRAGKLLNDILKAIDCPRETVFIGNVVKCRPPNNRDPETGEIEKCLPYLNRQIELIHPSVILALGRTAASALLNTRSSLGSLRNKVHKYRGIPLIVTYHPAALLRNPHWKKPTWDDVRIARRILAGAH